MPEGDERRTACIRCGTFVRDDERLLRDLAFCRECLDGAAPVERVKRFGAPRRVRLRTWLVISVAVGLAIATGLLLDALGVRARVAFLVADFSALGWWILLLLVDTSPRKDASWREHILRLHDFRSLAGEPPEVAMLWDGGRLFEVGLVFEGEDGLAFFGGDGSRRHVRFAEHGPFSYPLTFGRLPPILPRVRFGLGRGSLTLQALSNGRRGRRWAKAFVARRSQPRMRFETDARSS